MIILHAIEDLSTLSEPLILVGGTFDGVHRGHQALLGAAKEEAQQSGSRVVVMTFDRHPAAFLRPDQAPRILTQRAEKIELFNMLEVDVLLLLTFEATLAAMSAEDFIYQLVIHSSELKAIYVGASWSFGQGGQGNVALLAQLGEKFHFSLQTIAPIYLQGAMVSSTRIRQLINQGDFKSASALLGRPYTLSGSVIPGAGRGRVLGIPTANLPVGNLQLPPNGVYLASASWKGTTYQALVNLGVRPTIDSSNHPITLEAHLLDFQGDLYGEELKIEFVHFLREERKFATLEQLKSQILEDIRLARTLH